MKIRNPVLHPYKSFKHQWDSMKLRDDKNFIKTPLKLVNNVHPVMEQSAENLEYCFHKMNWVVSEIIIQVKIMIVTGNVTQYESPLKLIYETQNQPQILW